MILALVFTMLSFSLFISGWGQERGEYFAQDFPMSMPNSWGLDLFDGEKKSELGEKLGMMKAS